MTLDPTESATHGFPWELISKLAASSLASRPQRASKKKAAKVPAEAAASVAELPAHATPAGTSEDLLSTSFLPAAPPSTLDSDLEWNPALVCGLATPPPPASRSSFSATKPSAPAFPPTSAVELSSAAASTVTAWAAAVADSAHLVAAAVKGEDTLGAHPFGPTTSTPGNDVGRGEVGSRSEAPRANRLQCAENGGSERGNVDQAGSAAGSLQTTSEGERKRVSDPPTTSHSAPDVALVSFIPPRAPAEAASNGVHEVEQPGTPSLGLTGDDEEVDEAALDEVGLVDINEWVRF